MTNRERLGLGLVLGVAAIAMLYGWWLFWFLTDDSFIAFRYIANSHLGFGYVWNFPPFQPVEGYTSFLWVFLLDIVWRVTGIEPPVATNPLALCFAYGSLTLTTLLVWRIPYTPSLGRWRVVWVALALIGVISNRTFLAWSSSGLETAMFNFFLLAWVAAAILLPHFTPRWVVGITFTASLLYLTRPDGLLMFAATLALLGIGILLTKQRTPFLLATAPLLLIPAHLLWRYTTYGAWLPNTFYAKVGNGAQWESGSRYLFAFIMEYTLWMWIGFGVIAISTAVVRFITPRAQQDKAPPTGAYPTWLLPAIVGLTVIAHAGYYTIWIGGDHFEFRVYSQLVPLLWVGLIFLFNSIRFPAPIALGSALLAILLSLPLQWGHWTLTHHLNTRAETGFLRVSLSDAAQSKYMWLPPPLIAYLRAYDDTEFWLIERAIGMRHQEHKIFQQWLSDTLGPRPIDLQPPDREQQRVMLAASVGVISWRYGDVNVIDILGLNDYVIAREPMVEGGYMAHNRVAPPGYLECFVNPPRNHEAVPITGDQIRACEASFR